MLSLFLPILFTLFVVIDPIGIVPIFIGLTSHIPEGQKKRIINKAVGIAFLVLAFFILLGNTILSLLNIESGAFFIAGGIMLFLVSLDMLFGRPTKSKVSDREQSPEEDEGISLAVFPLAIPMLAGPGAITAIILKTGSGENFPAAVIMLFIALAIIMAAAWCCLRASALILKILGNTGVSVLERIMGLLLSGMSVQFVYDGIVRLGFLG
jgi:multiple antibiotic resistance protein